MVRILVENCIEFRREILTQDTDTSELEGDVVGVGPTSNLLAGRKDYAIYAETSIPVTSPEMGIPGLHSLVLGGAFRFEEFLNNSTNVIVAKVSLRWQPFDDQLTIRALKVSSEPLLELSTLRPQPACYRRT
jgi:hypothetical protein